MLWTETREFHLISHAKSLSRRAPDGSPLYRITSGGNVLRTRPITKRLKRRVLDRDGNACVECGPVKFLGVAHITPYRETGDNSLPNLRTLCHDCHMAEG